MTSHQISRRRFLGATAAAGAGALAGRAATASAADSPPDGSPGVLFGFVGGDEARSYSAMSPADRRAAALGSFANYFGAQARNASEYYESIWPGERWHRGGPVGVAGPGTLIAHGQAFREVTGDIHWAGTESSTFWTGYMDGAVRSGQRAAGEVLSAL